MEQGGEWSCLKCSWCLHNVMWSLPSARPVVHLVRAHGIVIQLGAAVPHRRHADSSLLWFVSCGTVVYSGVAQGSVVGSLLDSCFETGRIARVWRAFVRRPYTVLWHLKACGCCWSSCSSHGCHQRVKTWMSLLLLLLLLLLQVMLSK